MQKERKKQVQNDRKYGGKRKKNIKRERKKLRDTHKEQ